MTDAHASTGGSDQETLDLSSIPGIREHFDRKGQFPILVFRAPRRIQIVLSPFPGAWKLVSPNDSRGIQPGTNTFHSAIELQAGDELGIVSIMSAHAPTGPRVQVPVDLCSDVGELDSVEDGSEVQADAAGFLAHAGGAR